MKIYLIFTTILILTISSMVATTIDPANKYAYGANIGWINAEADTTNGAVIGQAFCTGYMYGANVGWINLGDGDPADHIAYANNSATDFGINHDGNGNLSGYAYGANIGWINFEQAYGKPKVNLETGELDGYAWGANIGWINLSTLATLTLDSGPDTDSDGIADTWEYGHTNNLAVLGKDEKDYDGDGASDIDEYNGDTDPFDPNDYLRITAIEKKADTNLVTWPCKFTREYTLQDVTVLTNGVLWKDTDSSFMPSSTPVTKEISGVTDDKRFYRIHVNLPLSP